MPNHEDKPSTRMRQIFWPRSFSLLFVAVVLSACQIDNAKPSKPTTQESKQQLKPTSRSEWRNLLGWNDGCEQSFSSTQASDYSGIESHPIGDADELVIVMCAAASYQPSFLLYRLKQQIPSALALETYVTTDGQTLNRSQEAELWGEPVFSANTKELVILSVARQTRDCGTWAKYGFTPDAAVLVNFYAKLPCPKEMKEPVSLDLANPPEGWKQIYTR